MESTVQKIVYLANEYPRKKITEIAGMFQLPALEVNAAVWMAQDSGYITVNEDTKKFTVDRVPDAWILGDDVEQLMQNLMYVFTRLARDEVDVEENFLTNWMRGYPAQDTLIAIKQLIHMDRLHEYKLKNKNKEEYTFFTLITNKGKDWGKKQFKTEIPVEGGDKKGIKVPVKQKMTPHPAITMSKRRAEAWTKQATDEDYFKYLQALANIYAKRKYKEGLGVVSGTLLFTDFKKWQDDVKIEASLIG